MIECGLFLILNTRVGKLPKYMLNLMIQKQEKLEEVMITTAKVNGAAPVTMVDIHSIKLHSHMINCKRVQFPVILPWGCTVDKV